MNPKIKDHLISASFTFIATFLAVVSIQLQAGVPANINTTFFAGLVIAGARAGVKAVAEEWLFKKKEV